MATKAELKRYMDKRDERTLQDAVRVIRRRRIIPEIGSQAAMCRALLAEASVIRRELSERADA